MSDRWNLIVHENEVLTSRVILLRVTCEKSVRSNIDPRDPLVTMWKPIDAFSKVVAETIKRLDNLQPEHARANRKATLGYFEKQLRRARIHRDELERLSKRIMFDGGHLGRIVFERREGEDREVHEILRDMHLGWDLRHDEESGFAAWVRRQVPAILALQDCVYAAMVTTIATKLRKIYAKDPFGDQEEDEGRPGTPDDEHHVEPPVAALRDEPEVVTVRDEPEVVALRDEPALFDPCLSAQPCELNGKEPEVASRGFAHRISSAGRWLLNGISAVGALEQVCLALMAATMIIGGLRYLPFWTSIAVQLVLTALTLAALCSRKTAFFRVGVCALLAFSAVDVLRTYAALSPA